MRQGRTGFDALAVVSVCHAVAAADGSEKVNANLRAGNADSRQINNGTSRISQVAGLFACALLSRNAATCRDF